MDCVAHSIGCGSSGASKMNTDVRTQGRVCTDLPCFAAFIVALAVVSGVFYIPSLKHSSVDMIIQPHDHQLRRCGIDGRGEYGYWPDMKHPRFKMCVDSCDNRTTLVSGVSVPTKTVHLYCFPDYALAPAELTMNKFKKATVMAEIPISQSVVHLRKYWWILPVTLLFSLVLSILFIQSLRLSLGCVIWTLISAVVCSCGVFSWFLFHLAGKMNKDGDSHNINLILFSPDATTLKILGGIVAGFGVLLALLCLLLYKRIQLAIELTKAASVAIADLPSTLLFPLLPLLIHLGWVATWLTLGAFILADAPIKNRDTPASLLRQFPNELENTYKVRRYRGQSSALMLHLFVILWVHAAIDYWCFAVLGGVFGEWYFADWSGSKHTTKKRVSDGNSQHRVSRFPVSTALKRVSVYHTGSIFFAAAVIAAIRWMRWMFEFMANRLSAKNSVAKALRCLLSCILKCLECTINKINRGGLLMTAMFGDSFCVGSVASFKLIWSSMLRSAIVGFFSHILTWLGKFLVLCGTVALFTLASLEGWYLKSEDKDQSRNVFSVLIPALVVACVAHFTASLVMSVMDSAIDTLFLCFLIDEKYNIQAMFAPPSVAAVVSKVSRNGDDNDDTDSVDSVVKKKHISDPAYELDTAV